jgi:acyl-CoA thioesterase-1
MELPKPAAAVPPVDTRPVVLCFGDSITAGFGLEAGQTYPDILQKLVDEKGYKYQVVNAGISGDTTQGGIDRLTDLLKLSPKVTLLELGGNDGLRGIPLERTRDHLFQMATRFETKGSKILVLGITLPRNYGTDYVRSFEAMYKGLAKSKNYPFMPFVLEGVYNQKGMMQEDGIHPTAKGAAQVARNVFKYLEPLLSK